jgi:hypothetical protein
MCWSFILCQCVGNRQLLRRWICSVLFGTEFRTIFPCWMSHWQFWRFCWSICQGRWLLLRLPVGSPCSLVRGSGMSEASSIFCCCCCYNNNMAPLNLITMLDERANGCVKSIVERTYEFTIQTLQTDLPLWRYRISHKLSCCCCWKCCFCGNSHLPTAYMHYNGPLYAKIRNFYVYMVESCYFECKTRISCIPGTLKSVVLNRKGSDVICTYTRGYNYGLDLLHALQVPKNSLYIQGT